MRGSTPGTRAGARRRGPRGLALAMRLGELLLAGLPRGLRRRLDDRVFRAIFHLTRVTNDHYPSTGRHGGSA